MLSTQQNWGRSAHTGVILCLSIILAVAGVNIAVVVDVTAAAAAATTAVVIAG